MTFCSRCGNEEMPDKTFCSKCGTSLIIGSNSDGVSKPTTTRESRWWYLVPIFLGVAGSVIAYFLLKDKDRKLAKNCVYVGIIFTVAPGVLLGIISALAGMYSYQ